MARARGMSQDGELWQLQRDTMTYTWDQYTRVEVYEGGSRGIVQAAEEQCSEAERTEARD